MDITQAFPSKYVSAADLQGQEVTVTMARCVMESVQGDNGTEDDLPVLYFEGARKGMVLNKTNANTIMSLYGKLTEQWAGRQITLYGTETSFQGRMVSCIRVRSVVPAAPAIPAAAPAQAPAPAPASVEPPPAAPVQATQPAPPAPSAGLPF